MKRFQNNQNPRILTNIYIAAVHTVGAYFGLTFFFYSLAFYSIQSQLSIVNDIWTLKRGTTLIKVPF
jgi:hypothetical protein